MSIVCVGAVVWWASRQEAPDLPDDPASFLALGGALALYGVATVVRGWRWHQVLRHAGVEHRAADAYGLVVVGYMGNAVLPARAGEVLRIFLLAARSDARRREVLGAIVPERIVDAAALAVLMACLGAANVAGNPAGTWPAIVAAGGVLGLGLGLFVYDRLRRAGYFEAFAARVRPVAGASRVLVTPWGLGLLLATLLVWLIEGCILVLCGSALDLSLPLDGCLYAVILASFVSLIPAAPGYLGTFDAALLFVLHRLDVSGGAALGVAVLFRFVIFVPITIAGLVLLVARYGGLGALRDFRRPVPEPSG